MAGRQLQDYGDRQGCERPDHVSAERDQWPGRFGRSHPNATGAVDRRAEFHDGQDQARGEELKAEQNFLTGSGWSVALRPISWLADHMPPWSGSAAVAIDRVLPS